MRSVLLAVVVVLFGCGGGGPREGADCTADLMGQSGVLITECSGSVQYDCSSSNHIWVKCSQPCGASSCN